MIYYVEDDVNIRELVIYTLEKSGLPAQGFTDGTAFWQAMQAKRPDLVLLDIMLPGEDGLTILQRLRRDPDTAQLPIIMLTAKGAEYDKVIGLDSGADDYVSKPFGMMELVSRVRALLRRTVPQPGEGVLSCGAGDGGRRPASGDGKRPAHNPYLEGVRFVAFSAAQPGHGIFQGKAAAGRVGIRL